MARVSRMQPLYIWQLIMHECLHWLVNIFLTLVSMCGCDWQCFRYCTGGIRCEMASAYIRSKGAGYENVFQVGLTKEIFNFIYW